MRKEEEVRKPRIKKDKPKTSSSTSSKKLPFIGRMPVFKKQQSDKKYEEEKDKEDEKPEQTESSPVEPEQAEEMEICEDDDMGLMPDPLQYSVLMGPPPAPPFPSENRIEEILPPGIDEAEREFIPKPINDAPIRRKGPLPKDFQETLDLLFDADTNLTIPEFPKIEIPAPQPIETPTKPDTDQPHMLRHEDVFAQYPPIQSPFIPLPPAAPTISADEDDFKKSNIAPLDIPIPPKISEVDSSRKSPEKTNGDVDDSKEENKNPKVDEKHNGIDLAEMALLGIDVDDLACINFTKN